MSSRPANGNDTVDWRSLNEQGVLGLLARRVPADTSVEWRRGREGTRDLQFHSHCRALGDVCAVIAQWTGANLGRKAKEPSAKCYSKTTVYYEIHERSECISVDCGLTNLIHDRRSCVDFTLSGSVIGRLHIRIYSCPIRAPLNIDPSSLLRLNARRIYI